MNTDEAYLMGLFIGGGVFQDDNCFYIRLPYRKWGDCEENPQRCGKIARDIMQGLNNKIKALYGVTVQYQETSKQWKVFIEGDISPIKHALLMYGIKPAGELRGNVDLSMIVNSLIDSNLKNHFIAGLADSIGSVAKSHRNRTNEHPTISFEIPGFNFSFVCSLCKLLYSINCIPNQVNWNHPNIHSTYDPYSKDWKKGFKVRVLLDQYCDFGRFAFSTKALVLKERRELRGEVHKETPCEEKCIKVTPSTVHIDENSRLLPRIIANGHYIHFMHFCAVLGCEHAQCDELNNILSKPSLLGKYIIPFPILYKDSEKTIRERINNNDILRDRTYNRDRLYLSEIWDVSHKNHGGLLYGNNKNVGYPVTIIMQAMAYLLADETELRGKKHRGKYINLLKRKLEDKDSFVYIERPEILTPIVLTKNGRAALVASRNPSVYAKLIERDEDNRYKISVRKITEKDFQ